MPNVETRDIFEEWFSNLREQGKVYSNPIKEVLLDAFEAGHASNKITSMAGLTKGDLFRKVGGRQVYVVIGYYNSGHDYMEAFNAKGNRITVPPNTKVVRVEDEATFFTCKEDGK